MPTIGENPDMLHPDAFNVLLASLEQSGLKPDAGMGDLIRHFTSQDPAQLRTIVDAVEKMRADSASRVENFDFSSLGDSIRVKKDSFWILQCDVIGFEDSKRKRTKYYVPGSDVVCTVVIYDEAECFRMEEKAPLGLPSSEFLIKCIKRSIVSPLVPLRPSLPEVLIIAHKLKAHIPALQPFLDSLPKPFTWRLESAAEAENTANDLYEFSRTEAARLLAVAEAEKPLGNQAFARKDREGAVKHYTAAIDALDDALGGKLGEDDERRINSLLSVCLANCAAAWLMEGAGQDAEKALALAKTAVKANEDYAKAYYRQAKAHQALGQTSEVIDVLTSSLRRPGLSADKGLNDALVDAYGGFPDTAEDLAQFCRKLFVSEDGDKRPRELVEFKRRTTVHLRAVLGDDASIDSM